MSGTKIRPSGLNTNRAHMRAQRQAGLEAALARGIERIATASRYPMHLLPIPTPGTMHVVILDRPYVMTLQELRQLRDLADEGIRRLTR